MPRYTFSTAEAPVNPPSRVPYQNGQWMASVTMGTTGASLPGAMSSHRPHPHEPGLRARATGVAPRDASHGGVGLCGPLEHHLDQRATGDKPPARGTEWDRRRACPPSRALRPQGRTPCEPLRGKSNPPRRRPRRTAAGDLRGSRPLRRGLTAGAGGQLNYIQRPILRCPSGRRRPAMAGGSYLVDSASSHMLVSKIKPCMSKYKQLYSETANGSLYKLSFI